MMVHQENQHTAIVILAAGQGKRMNCPTSKVMQMLGGQSLVQRVVNNARLVQPGQLLLVLASDQSDIRTHLDGLYPNQLTFVEQVEQKGTGHAVACALPHLHESIKTVLVLYGDVPMIDHDTLTRVLTYHTTESQPSPSDQQSSGVVVLVTDCTTAEQCYGRIVHDSQGRVEAIVEYRDCTEQQRKIKRVSSGVMLLPCAPLAKWLKQLNSDNNQAELYLTDVIAMARGEGLLVAEVTVPEQDVQGVNTMADLARLERIYNQKCAERLMDQGVRFNDPQRFDCRGQLVCGRDVCIDINCVIEGRVELGDGVTIGPNCYLKDCVLEEGGRVLAYSCLEGVNCGKRVRIGPFARIRPTTALEDEAQVGNFVEIKNCHLHRGVKASHLNYIGDSSIGAQTNIGAGAVTCNYDGEDKHRTEIGDKAFIGSGVMMVAPLRIGNEAVVGAGAVVRRDIDANSLVYDKVEQRLKSDYTPRRWRAKTSKASQPSPADDTEKPSNSTA